jgi:hypothetical protein
MEYIKGQHKKPFLRYSLLLELCGIGLNVLNSNVFAKRQLYILLLTILLFFLA